MTAKTITTADLAAEFETTPRTLRKFLRSETSGIESVGKGKRYALPSTKSDLKKMRSAFDAWQAATAKVDEVEAIAVNAEGDPDE